MTSFFQPDILEIWGNDVLKTEVLLNMSIIYYKFIEDAHVYLSRDFSMSSLNKMNLSDL